MGRRQKATRQDLNKSQTLCDNNSKGASGKRENTLVFTAGKTSIFIFSADARNNKDSELVNLPHEATVDQPRSLPKRGAGPPLETR